MVERGELRYAVLQVLLGHNGVPPVDTLGLVPRKLHGHGPGDAGPLQVPDRGAAEVMGEAIRETGQPAARIHARRKYRIGVPARWKTQGMMLPDAHSIARA